jgi:Cu(I)/Ag(I) efflux system membrane protein CusA/SilA
MIEPVPIHTPRHEFGGLLRQQVTDALRELFPQATTQHHWEIIPGATEEINSLELDGPIKPGTFYFASFSVVTPVENIIVAGAPGVERVRSSASFAQATVNMEFAWGSDTLRNRQVVQERLSRAQLPTGVRVTLGPSTSLLGEIMWVGLDSSDGNVSPMELRTLADWTIRPALLKVSGVADVLVMGGDVREWQININALALRRYGIMIDDVRANVEDALTNKSGGLLTQDEKEYSIRILSAPKDINDLKDISIGRNKIDNRPIRLSDIATVIEGASIIRGSGAINGKPGVILRIIRQPDAQTLTVTDEINSVFTSMKASLPSGVELQPNLFRQENFIRAGLSNVEGALRDGTILVIIVLIVFLMNARITMIT